MKKLILTISVAILGCLTSHAQTYQHDFQKAIGLPYDGVTNYTLEHTRSGGYAIAGIKEEYGALGINQRTIVMFVTDAEFNILSTLECTAEADEYGNLFVPKDIHETTDGNFVLCGVILQESATSNGGFLMHVNYDRRDGLFFDWINVYLNSNAGGNSSVSLLNRVVEIEDGYMAIGRSDYASTTRGIVIGTNRSGDVVWSKQLFDDQYGTNYQSVLNDMVRIDGNNVAIVGTVNSFTIDDADIYVIILDESGNRVNERVYERQGKKYGDGQPAYLERGNAIAFNEDLNALIIVGTAMQKEEGVCTTADFRRILTLEVDFATLNLNWSRMHEINADLEIANEGLTCSDIAFDPLSNQYAITGTVRNDALSVSASENGFIMRLDPLGNSIDLRYYGTEELGRLSKIYANGLETGTFAACGMTKNGGKNYAWAVESYMTIEDDCHQISSEALTDLYPLQTQKGIEKVVRVEKVGTRCELVLPITEEEVLCESILLSRTPLTTQTPDVKNETQVYPTVLNNGTVLTIDNKNNYETYSLINLNGSQVVKSGTLVDGINRIKLDQLATGIYIVQVESGTNEQAIFKIIVD